MNKNGQVVTFYSYKGGTGRSMALANVAVLLARWGYKVLLVDWDLEAPGMEFFFQPYLSDEQINREREGIIELLSSNHSGVPGKAWKELITAIRLKEGISVDLLSAGSRNSDYFQKVVDLNIEKFYSDDGGKLIETIREQWKMEYDFVLVDSRTGITDIGGICTIQLPDYLVLLFTPTEQALEGILHVSNSILAAQQQLPVERQRLMLIPVVSRVEVVQEHDLREEWISKCADKLRVIYRDWLPISIEPLKMIQETKLPYIPFYSFGEKLAVIKDTTSESGSLRFAYENLAALIARKLSPAAEFIDNRQNFVNNAAKQFRDIFKREPGLKSFLQYHLQANRHLPMQGFANTLSVPIELERVYVSPQMNVGDGQREYASGSHEGLFARNNKSISSRYLRKDVPEPAAQVNLKQTFDALRKQQAKDMVILGDPGSGKTTLLKYILVMLIEGRGKDELGIDTSLIPFFLPLRDLDVADIEKPFEQFILRICKCVDYDITGELLRTILSDGKGIVLLDGLDEIIDEQTRIAVCRWIDGARELFRSTYFIITSRFAGYRGMVCFEKIPVLELTMQGFSIEDVAEFLTRWYETVRLALNPTGDEAKVKKAAAEEARGLIDEIEASGTIRSFAANPLLLQNIALVRSDRGAAPKLPERRVELYRECTDTLLANWDMAKGFKKRLTAQQTRKVLQPIALWLHEKEGRRSAPRGELEGEIRKSLDNIGCSDITPEALLRNIGDRSGIIRGYGINEYGFTHLIFQEYLAAEEIRNQHQIKQLVKNFENNWWREVTLLALGLDNPSILEEFIKAVISSGKLKGDISIVIDGVRDSITKPVQIFIEATNRNDLSIEERQNGVRVIESIGNDLAVKALQDIASGKDAATGRAAHAALVRMHATEAIVAVEHNPPNSFTWEVDDSEMAFVPAGKFQYGSKDDDHDANSDEKPRQSLFVPDYYISIHPVTNAQYKKFIDETGHRPPEGIWNGEKIWEDGSFNKEKADHPVVFVSWADATAYVKWAGLSLPTEVLWEKAARGADDGRIYPWGNDWNSENCNSIASGKKWTTPVGSFKEGISPVGGFDMAGNVWEWCEDWYNEENLRSNEKLMGPSSGSFRVLRGGAFNCGSKRCRCSQRNYDIAESRSADVGFRVVFIPNSMKT